MTAVELIQRKRDGGKLSAEEIDWLIRSYVDGTVPDYQMAAMAMAIFLRGLDADELAAWTGAMLHSGDVLDLSDIPRPKVDKHSTGGVGDKVSIPLAPMVAACGVAVPMMSGRGLGHTGGTLDKLESIPGFTTALDADRFHDVLARCGLVLAGQSESLDPADRKLYALRDATGTVESIPLIASSICSKKLTEDLDALVLDVKVGSGAFMKELSAARTLAETMVGIGRAHGVAVTAFLTDMNVPLGHEVGNANEIRESLEVLRGGGPADLVEIVLTLGAEMLRLADIAEDIADARRRLEKVRRDGSALEAFRCVVEAQGGDPAVLDEPSLLPSAPHCFEMPAPRSGFVVRCDAYDVGMAAVRLGAGRERKEDEIDPGVGITVVTKPGDEVTEGQTLARVTYRDPARRDEARDWLQRAWEIGDSAPAATPLVLDRIEG